MAGEWRYLAQRLHGDGTGTFLHTEVPLTEVAISEVLSGPAGLTGTVPVELASLKGDDGRPLLEPWSTALYAEADGVIRGGGILVSRTAQGPALELDCAGFSYYAKDMPYTDSYFGVDVDPMDMARLIWDHLQGQAYGNLGLVLDTTTSPKRIGTELETVQFGTVNGPVSFEAGPYKLAWYQTSDLGGEFDSLAKETPFDYLERHTWNEAGTDIDHRLILGYPSLGLRRHDLSFVLGENISVPPPIAVDGASFANGVLALGAGEGRNQLSSGVISQADERLRRIAVVTDKGLRSKTRLVALAREELALRRITDGDIGEIQVRNHPHAPIGSWQVGDEIRVQADVGWDHTDIWCRVLSTTISPERADFASLVIQRSTKAAA